MLMEQKVLLKDHSKIFGFAMTCCFSRLFTNAPLSFSHHIFPLLKVVDTDLYSQKVQHRKQFAFLFIQIAEERCKTERKKNRIMFRTNNV